MASQLSRLYVGNLHFATTKREVEEFFQSKGLKVSCAYLSRPKTGAPAGHQNSGFAFVTTSQASDVPALIALDSGKGPRDRDSLLVRPAAPKPADS